MADILVAPSRGEFVLSAAEIDDDFEVAAPESMSWHGRAQDFEVVAAVPMVAARLLVEALGVDCKRAVLRSRPWHGR